ncbi:MAG: ribosomal protein L13e [Candidatus Bathyarchaeota archaeon]|nr:ribosomal protein L13e [Candidatus Bathyarchaeota archaeon]
MVRMVTPTVRRGRKTRAGKGFSLSELSELGLSVGEARHLGVPVDLSRSTSYDENVERLRAWMEEAEKEGFRVPRPRQLSKGQRGRAYRGLTSSGKKMRGLRKA